MFIHIHMYIMQISIPNVRKSFTSYAIPCLAQIDEQLRSTTTQLCIWVSARSGVKTTFCLNLSPVEILNNFLTTPKHLGFDDTSAEQ